MLSDLRNALRAFLAAPGFTLVALAVLTLGIGATAAIFSMVDAVVLRGLPFDEADRLVAVNETDLRNKGAAMSVAPQNFADWKRSRTCSRASRQRPAAASRFARAGIPKNYASCV